MTIKFYSLLYKSLFIYYMCYIYDQVGFNNINGNVLFKIIYIQKYFFKYIIIKFLGLLMIDYIISLVEIICYIFIIT
jgi:hypothetical protein